MPKKETKVKSHRRGNVLVRSFRRKQDDSKENKSLGIKTTLSLGALGIAGLAATKKLGQKPLGKLVGSGNQGKVFRLGDTATKVYKNSKLARKEFNLLKELEDTGVTPKPFNLSGARVQMEAVAGQNIKDAIKDFSTDDSLSNLATTLADSVKAIHEKGIVHGDLGVDNIIVDKSGRLRIIDLGMGFKPTTKLNPNTDLNEISSAFNVLLKEDSRKAKLFQDKLYKRYFNLE